MTRRPEVQRVRVDPRAWDAYGLSGSMPVGAIVVLPGGVVVRIREDGGVDEVGGVPMRKSIAADPTAGREQRR